MYEGGQVKKSGYFGGFFAVSLLSADLPSDKTLLFRRCQECQCIQNNGIKVEEVNAPLNK